MYFAHLCVHRSIATIFLSASTDIDHIFEYINGYRPPYFVYIDGVRSYLGTSMYFAHLCVHRSIATIFLSASTDIDHIFEYINGYRPPYFVFIDGVRSYLGTSMYFAHLCVHRSIATIFLSASTDIDHIFEYINGYRPPYFVYIDGVRSYLGTSMYFAHLCVHRSIATIF
ncbi:hypothetical protein CEXT_20951 [Caerostris extrusa]|uniref:Uncharacterized protein n=1 Tax=Caerostris extrusa TaxID=172846 RepID=A0AAV4REG5_CAEEX|nr:hypothetical protein CEXT_20951 [Caerostris extrusa]